MSEGSLSFRPIAVSDEPFLRQVYASTRAAELRMVNWTDPQKDAFLRMQFDAQHQHYQKAFPSASFSIVLLNGMPIGRLYLEKSGSEFRIIDIAILDEHRGKGLGTAMLTNILMQARQVGKPVLIHVERNNPALRLYQRLGFQPVEEGPVYLLLRTAM